MKQTNRQRRKTTKHLKLLEQRRKEWAIRERYKRRQRNKTAFVPTQTLFLGNWMILLHSYNAFKINVTLCLDIWSNYCSDPILNHFFVEQVLLFRAEEKKCLQETLILRRGNLRVFDVFVFSGMERKAKGDELSSACR